MFVIPNAAMHNVTKKINCHGLVQVSMYWLQLSDLLSCSSWGALISRAAFAATSDKILLTDVPCLIEGAPMKVTVSPCL